MKKLTAGIFAGILGMVSMGAADANVASTGWVNQQLGTKADTSTVTALEGTVQGLDTAVQGKAAQADLEALGTRVKTAEDDIDAIDLKIGTDALPLNAGSITAALKAINDKTASDQEVTDLKSSVQTLEGLVGTTSVGSQITGALADYYTKTEVGSAIDAVKLKGAGDATHAFYTDANGNAVTIETVAAATKATEDGDGNVITTTYATKGELPTAVSQLTNDAKYQSDSEVQTAISNATAADGVIGQALANKQNKLNQAGDTDTAVYIGADGQPVPIEKVSAAANADHATSADSATNATNATNAYNYVAGGTIESGLAGKVDVPTVDASSSAYGKYVLTADKTAQGTTYYWEQIERAKEGETEIF